MESDVRDVVIEIIDTDYIGYFYLTNTSSIASVDILDSIFRHQVSSILELQDY